jgi:putative sterol carrier protein
LNDPLGLWLDLDRGVCREAKLVSVGEASQAAFVLTSDYGRWKEVIRKQLGPIAGIMQRKITLQGSLPIVVRFIKSAEALVEAATRVPTRFLDE